MLDLSASCIHVFQLDNRWFLFDGEEMLVAEISVGLAEAIGLMVGTDYLEFTRKVTLTHGRETAERITNELERMHAVGFFNIGTDDSLPHFDQVKRMARQQTPDVVALQLLVSGVCNLRCSYCYADQGTFQHSTQNRFMDVSLLRDALGLLTATKKTFLVNLLGGEPLLHPRIADILNIIQAHGFAHGQIACVDITTNGTIFPKDLVPQLREMNVQVGISLDGKEALHDKQRPKVNGSGSYRTVVDTALAFIEALGPNRTRIRVTCTAESAPGMVEFYHFIRHRFGAVRIDFAPAISGSPEESSVTREFADTFAAMKRTIIQHEIAESATTLNLTRDEVLERLQTDRIYQRWKLTSKCEFGVNLLCVTADGDLYPCVGVVGHQIYNMGNIRNGGARTNRAVQQLYASNTVLARSECSTCWAKYLCAGGCPAVNALVSGDVLKSTSAMCDLYKSSAELSLFGFIARAGFRELLAHTKEEFC